MIRGMMRTPVWRTMLAGIGLSFLVVGCSSEAPPTEEKAPPAPVKWMEPRQLFVEEWTEVVGTTQPLPDRAAKATAAVEGRVVFLLPGEGGKPLVEGQHVAKGDVLARLDDRVARANRDKAAADQEDLKQQLKQAGYAIELAQIELRRLQELKATTRGSDPLVSPVQLEKAQVGLEDAKSRQAGAVLRLEAGEKQLKALDEQLRLYAITAPISGRLSRLFVVPGQTLAVGTIVAEILDLQEQIDLLCFVPPHVVRKLKLGQSVRVGGLNELAATPAGSAAAPVAERKAKGTGSTEGKVVFIADQSELDTGNFAVKVRFPNAILGLRGNLTVRARVLTTPGKAALTLPEAALMEDQDPPAVIAVEDLKEEKKEGKDVETGKARKLLARVGIRDRVLHLVEILGVEDPEKKWQGSLDSTKFVIEGGQGLRNGDPVRLAEEDEDEAAPPEEKKEGAS
jgi:RND family efflux transporter MFP subunit